MISCAFCQPLIDRAPYFPPFLKAECQGIYLLPSWQAWLCGGSVEILPCSRVGHIYGNQDAPSPVDQEATLRNKVRIAETWLGSFKETFYRHSPEAFSLSKVRREPGGASVSSTGPAAGGGPGRAPFFCLEGKTEDSGLSFPRAALSQVAPLPGEAVLCLSGFSMGHHSWPWPEAP